MFLYSRLSSILDVSWVVTICLAFFTFYAAKLWLQRETYPPGPRAWPIFGNMFSIKSESMSNNPMLYSWPKKYGDILTLWLGGSPMLLISSWDYIKDALVTQKNNFSGRSPSIAGSFTQEGYDDIIFSDYGPNWIALRKIGSLAIRKYATSHHLAVLVSDVVDKCIPLMLKEKESFDITNYLFLTTYNIMASTAFGIRYEMDDPEFVRMKDLNVQMNDEFKHFYSDIIPHFHYLFYLQERRMKKISEESKSVVRQKYEHHKGTYVAGEIRDFTDAVLAAREEAILEGKQNMENIEDEHLVNVVFNLFGAGIDTTKGFFLWFFLYLANNPDIQEKIRQEILDNIGDRIPVQEDKQKCHHFMAFISEVLRLRPVINFTIEHKTVVDTQLGDQFIKKGLSCFFHILAQHMSTEFWETPEVFKPDRFLEEDGSFTKRRLNGFMPFGMGRRGCVGEKLARADIFLIGVRFLQKLRFSFPDGAGTVDLEPQNLVFLNIPNDFKIVVEKL